MSESMKKRKNEDDDGVDFTRGVTLKFHALRVPDEVPLRYDYAWMQTVLFNEQDTALWHCDGLGSHVYKWFEELRVHMRCLEKYIDKHKGQYFKRRDQFMYGSLLETMRDLLAKIIRATCGPGHCKYDLKKMDDRLAPFLKGVDGSGIE